MGEELKALEKFRRDFTVDHCINIFFIFQLNKYLVKKFSML